MRASWVWRVLFVLVVGDWDMAFVALAKWLATSGCDSLCCMSCWSIWDFHCIGDRFVDVLAAWRVGLTWFSSVVLWDLVLTSFGLHCIALVCLGSFFGVGETGFVEGFVLFGLPWKQGFSFDVVCGLGARVGFGSELLGTHL